MRFRFSENFIVDTDRAPWNVEGLRVAFFGAPGSGKSLTCAVLVEQFLDQGGTVVIFEPRYEWETLKQNYPVQVAGGPYADLPLAPNHYRLYAEAVVKNGLSLVVNTGDLEEEELIRFAEGTVRWILKLEETTRRPVMIVIEEASEFCPLRVESRLAPPWVYRRMVKQFRDCFTQGRKLNVSPVVISQRPQQLDFTIRALSNLTFFGKFSSKDLGYLDREVLRYYRDYGLDVKATQLLNIPVGSWLVIYAGKAETVTITEKRKTPHGAETPKLEYTAPITAEIQQTVSELAKMLEAELEKARLEESELEKAKRRISQLEFQVAELQEKLKVKETLTEIFSGVKVNGELKERIFELEERLRELESENAALRAEVEKNRRVLGQVKALVEGYPIVAPAAQPPPPTYAQPGQEVPEDLKDAVERLDPYTRKIYNFLLNRKGIPYTPYKLAVPLGIGPKSSRFKEALSLLVKIGAIRRERGYIVVR